MTGWIALHGVTRPLAIVGVEFPLFGYRYWIVVTNMAYPLQTNPGVVTYYTDRSYLEVIRWVQQKIDEYWDQEK